MGRAPAQFIPVTYVNANDESLSVFFVNLLVGFVAVAAFYNIYKGRNPPPKGSSSKGASKSDSWFGGGGMGGMGQMQKANFNVYGEDKKIETRFKDVAGHENAK